MLVVLLTLPGATMSFAAGEAGRAAVSPGQTQTSWVWRSDTIRERIYYLEVGWEMFRRRPVFGYGLGSVDHYFGRFKPAEARETRYLHNWVAQLGAETGLIGVLLACAMIGCFAMLVRTSWPEQRLFAVVGGLFWLDGLIQVTFNQREMIELWGIIFGATLGLAQSGTGGGSLSSPVRRAVGFSSAALPAFGLLMLVLLVGLVVPDLRAESYKFAASDAMESGKFSEAALDLTKAQAASPRDGDIALQRARIAARESNLSEAHLLSRKALELQPESASTQAFAAQLAIEDGDWQAARRYAEAAIERYPYNPDYLSLMARIEMAQGKKSAALNLGRRAIELSVGLYNHDDFVRQFEQLEAVENKSTSGSK
jgi:hypothetical protein